MAFACEITEVHWFYLFLFLVYMWRTYGLCLWDYHSILTLSLVYLWRTYGLCLWDYHSILSLPLSSVHVADLWLMPVRLLQYTNSFSSVHVENLWLMPVRLPQYTDPLTLSSNLCPYSRRSCLWLVHRPSVPLCSFEPGSPSPSHWLSPLIDHIM
jgi:hypothetical protein